MYLLWPERGQWVLSDALGVAPVSCLTAAGEALDAGWPFRFICSLYRNAQDKAMHPLPDMPRGACMLAGAASVIGEPSMVKIA